MKNEASSQTQGGVRKKRPKEAEHFGSEQSTSSGVSELSGARMQSKQCAASKWSEQANRQVSGTVLTSGFMVVLAHSAKKAVRRQCLGDIFEERV